jgi:hypothetical protein
VPDDHLIADLLRSAPDPTERAQSASEQLRREADAIPIDGVDLDAVARLRVRIKETVGAVLASALKKGWNDKRR